MTETKSYEQFCPPSHLLRAFPGWLGFSLFAEVGLPAR